MKLLLLTDLYYDDNKIEVETLAFCCDMPVRAFIKIIKGHNAYYGYDKCYVKGFYQDRRMAYLSLNTPLRTDESS